MYVYIVEEGIIYEGGWVDKVFLYREDAEKYIAQRKQENKELMNEIHRYISVEEYEVE